MKKFDRREIEIIERLLSYSGLSRSLGVLLESTEEFGGLRVRVDRTNRDVDFKYKFAKLDKDNLPMLEMVDHHQKVLDVLVRHLMLLRYLESEQLIFLYDAAIGTSDVTHFGVGQEDLSTISIRIYDQSIVDLVIKYSGKTIIPTSALKSLSENRFRTEEESRFFKQQVATWAAIASSILLGLIGLYGNYQSSNDDEKMLEALRIQAAENVAVIVGGLSKIEEAIANSSKSQVAVGAGSSQVKPGKQSPSPLKDQNK